MFGSLVGFEKAQRVIPLQSDDPKNCLTATASLTATRMNAFGPRPHSDLNSTEQRLDSPPISRSTLFSPHSADFLLTIIMKVPNFPIPCPKMPLLPECPVLPNFARFIQTARPYAEDLEEHVGYIIMQSQSGSCTTR